MMSAYRLIAKMPTIAAMAFKTSIGQPIVYPRNDLTFAENFLYMMFALPSEPYVVDPVVARALEVRSVFVRKESMAFALMNTHSLVLFLLF